MYNPLLSDNQKKKLNPVNPTMQGNKNATALANGLKTTTPQPKSKTVTTPTNLNSNLNNNPKAQVSPPTTKPLKVANVQNQVNAGNTKQAVNSTGVKVSNPQSPISSADSPKNPNQVPIKDLVNAMFNAKDKTINIGSATLKPSDYQMVDGKATVNPLALGTSLMSQAPDYTQQNFSSKEKLMQSVMKPMMESNQAFLNTQKNYVEDKYNLSNLQQKNALDKQLRALNEQKAKASGDLAQSLAQRGLDSSGVFASQMGDMAIDYAKLQNQVMDDNALREMQIGMEYDKNIGDMHNRTLDFKSQLQKQINDKALGMIEAEGVQKNQLGQTLINNHYKNQEFQANDKRLQQENRNNAVDLQKHLMEQFGRGTGIQTGNAEVDKMFSPFINKETQSTVQHNNNLAIDKTNQKLQRENFEHGKTQDKIKNALEQSKLNQDQRQHEENLALENNKLGKEDLKTAKEEQKQAKEDAKVLLRTQTEDYMDKYPNLNAKEVSSNLLKIISTDSNLSILEKKNAQAIIKESAQKYEMYNNTSQGQALKKTADRLAGKINMNLDYTELKANGNNSKFLYEKIINSSGGTTEKEPKIYSLTTKEVEEIKNQPELWWEINKRLKLKNPNTEQSPFDSLFSNLSNPSNPSNSE